MPYPAHMVFILFVQVLKKVLKSLKFELKNPAATLVNYSISGNILILKYV